MYHLSIIMLQRDFREQNSEMSEKAGSSCKLDITSRKIEMSKLQNLLTRQWFQGQAGVGSSG